jgi:hypothetical protein
MAAKRASISNAMAAATGHEYVVRLVVVIDGLYWFNNIVFVNYLIYFVFLFYLFFLFFCWIGWIGLDWIGLVGLVHCSMVKVKNAIEFNRHNTQFSLFVIGSSSRRRQYAICNPYYFYPVF